jgi:hypothetical protein
MHSAAVTRWLTLGTTLFVLGCGDGAPSDEDLIEKFIDDVAGPVDDAYVQRALGYVDMARFPLDVRVPHHGGVYDQSNGSQLVAMFKDGMRRHFYGSAIKVRGNRYEINGTRADVNLGLITTVGLLRAEIALQRASPGVWKVTKVHVDR